ncbi:MAG: winged helix-turn-helix transcriptional regulator [Burkholderiaceae bacterium]
MKSKATASKSAASVRGSTTGRPIMAALDLLGRRGSLRILWELREERVLTFRSLQEAAATNPSLLNTRLRELREAGIVAHEGQGYLLTASGKQLMTALAPLTVWAGKWAGR